LQVHHILLKSQAHIRSSLQIHLKLIVKLSQVAHGVHFNLQTFKLHQHLVKLRQHKLETMDTQITYA
jgi:hypothetical protein